jgi:hypothetical protein
MMIKRANRRLHYSLTLQALYQAHGPFLMRLAIYAMSVAALLWLGYEFWRLVWLQGYWGAIDLHQRYVEVHYWFSGKMVYGQLKTASYPPASYVLLWPFLGWMEFTQARWVWALATILALAWYIRLSLGESLARTSQERTFLALIPLSGYATGAAIDSTLPGRGRPLGHLHPLTRIFERTVDIFRRMGFAVEDGPGLRPLPEDELGLGRDIALEGAMKVQMLVLADIGQHGDGVGQAGDAFQTDGVR